MSGLLVESQWKGIPRRVSTFISFPEEIGDSQEPPPQPSTEGNLQIHKVIECGKEMLSCQFNPSGVMLAVGLINGLIQVYSVSDGTCVHTLQDDQSVTAVTALRFLPHRHMSQGDLLLASYAGGHVKFWHIPTQSCVRTLSEDRQTLTIAINPSGSHFLTAGSSDDILVYDTESMTCVNICQPSSSLSVMDGHRSRIFGLSFNPNSEEEFISGGWDDTIQFWNIHQQHSLRKICGPHVCGDSLHIDPVTNQILIGSWRKAENLQIWDYATGQKISTVPDDYRGPCRVYSCRWLGSDHMIAAGSDINMCRIIDCNSFLTRGRLIDLPSGIYSMDVFSFSPTVSPLIAVTSGQSIFLLRSTLRVNATSTDSFFSYSSEENPI
ncbi:uncharacterized WD repeat-containing protein alr2800-like [Pelobates fuscus]|uniref:uncharacterized WD repeat-containing protein alr2800-like n=1 Tax=Pelobates fuscus TaxID=191477 RepID=UPI002FE48F10